MMGQGKVGTAGKGKAGQGGTEQGRVRQERGRMRQDEKSEGKSNLIQRCRYEDQQTKEHAKT